MPREHGVLTGPGSRPRGRGPGMVETGPHSRGKDRECVLSCDWLLSRAALAIWNNWAHSSNSVSVVLNFFKNRRRGRFLCPVTVTSTAC